MLFVMNFIFEISRVDYRRTDAHVKTSCEYSKRSQKDLKKT